MLAFVVLITVILLTYLATTRSSLKRSTSSAAITHTELLAETATAAIVADIRQEMLAGSDGAAPPADGDPFLVSQPWAMVPGRVLAATIAPADPEFANLVKQSRRSAPFYPGTNPATFTAKGSAANAEGRTRGSSVSTADPSTSGRLVSTERWNQPRLLGGGGFTATDQLPDWILISRDGPLADGGNPGDFNDATEGNSDHVIGRFAYNIYDVGGLLDINAAGFPAAAASEAADKGSVAWADLTALPGLSDRAAIEDFFLWRNKLTAGSANGYEKLVNEWSEPRGFSAPYVTSGASENRFYSRQDLLDYVATHGSGAITPDALPFLTTFSADLDQPSFAPDPGRPKIQRDRASGGNDAHGSDDGINPNFLTVTDSNGDPVAKRRFPLDRLEAVVPDPPEPGEVADEFGLTWDASSYAWRYQVDGSTTEIKRLSEISGREPNFVELLKAAIGVGSLGGQFQNTSPPEPPGSPRLIGGSHGSVNYQIIQIAANIIDQFDADSYPTRIEFEGRTFFGAENLPYLYLIRTAPYRVEIVDPADITVPVPATPSPEETPPIIYRCALMLQPTLWNPHAPTTNLGDGPTEFRITASSGFDVFAGANSTWAPRIGGYVDYFPSSNPQDNSLPGGAVIAFNPATDVMSFSTTSTGKAAFRDPYTLSSPNYPPGSEATGYWTQPVLAGEEPNEEADGATTPATSVIGFKVGTIWGGPTTDGEVHQWFRSCRVLGNGIDFELQYRTPAGGWATYDVFPAFSASNPAWHDIPAGVTNRGRPMMRFSLKIDPRTDRYGPRDGNNYVHKSGTTDEYRHWFQGWSAWAANPYPAPYGSEPQLQLGKFSNGGATDPNAVNWTINDTGTWRFWMPIARNSPSDDIHYGDPDGVIRAGMAAEFDGAGTLGLPFATGNLGSRPVILDRPFRSVAELGYAFRGQPWKQLDFWTPKSADVALLDVFCIHEPNEPTAEPIVSGRVNLNTRQAPVVEALLRGVARTDGAVLPDGEANAIAEAFVEWTSGTDPGEGPLRNRAEIVGRFDPDLGGAATENFAGFSTELAAQLGSSEDRTLQVRRQNVLRALVDGGTTRTWAFLIDLIVQSGRYPASAATLDEFSISGEQRYWIHLAIDRYTGGVTARFAEAVND